MNRTGNGAALCEDPHDFLVMQNLYDAAVRQLTLKFNILNSEFNVLYARNPIHHIDGRVKSQSSIVAKLIKRGIDLKVVSWDAPQAASGGTVRVLGHIVEGIDQTTAKKINKDIKDQKLKVKVTIEADKLRVSSASKDALQTVIQFLRDQDYGQPLQFTNYR